MVRITSLATFTDGVTAESVHEVSQAEANWFILHYSTILNEWPNAELARVVIRVEAL
jgi:hypothetical protein